MITIYDTIEFNFHSYLSIMLTVQLFWVALAAIFVRLLFTGRRPKNYPPGPPTLPILGNIHLVSIAQRIRTH